MAPKGKNTRQLLQYSSKHEYRIEKLKTHLEKCLDSSVKRTRALTSPDPRSSSCSSKAFLLDDEACTNEPTWQQRQNKTLEVICWESAHTFLSYPPLPSPPLHWKMPKHQLDNSGTTNKHPIFLSRSPINSSSSSPARHHPINYSVIFLMNISENPSPKPTVPICF